MEIRMNNNSDLFRQIQKQVEEAEKAGKPINTLVRQQIDLLKNSHDEFVKVVQESGYERDDFRLAKIEINQYSAIKQLAQKIGLPVDEYDKLIEEIKIRVLGAENYRRFSEK